MAKDYGNLISTIDGVENYHSNCDISQNLISQEIQEYMDVLSKLAGEVQGLGELERKLREEFGTEIIEIDGFRLANAIGVAGTLIRRHVENIILPQGETSMPTKTNLGGNVIDSIGFSSKVPAPSEGYGFMGKISQLRPNSRDFNGVLHRKVMERLIKIQPKGIAFEIGTNEKALMPVFSIDGIEDLVSQFSDIKQESDTQTSKYYGINS